MEPRDIKLVLFVAAILLGSVTVLASVMTWMGAEPSVAFTAAGQIVGGLLCPTMTLIFAISFLRWTFQDDTEARRYAGALAAEILATLQSGKKG